MAIFDILVVFLITVLSSFPCYADRWCDAIGKLDCSKAPHNELDYLCGTDGKTYRSRCELNKQSCAHNIQMAHKGKCNHDNGKFVKLVCDYIETIICHGLEPVCGNNQVSYDNGCELVKAHCKDDSIIESYKGFCAPITTPKSVTIDPFCQNMKTTACHGVNPICGTDNNLYDNACEYEKAKCLQPTLRIKKMGIC